MWEIRVIIPVKLGNKMLDVLHVGHIGIMKMKELSRSFFWWPKLDSDIEQLARKCSGCKIHQKTPPKASLHPWKWPSAPCERIQIDFAGSFLEHMFLIKIDAHLKWPEVHVMNSITASKTIDVLRQIFAQFGVLKQTNQSIKLRNHKFFESFLNLVTYTAIDSPSFWSCLWKQKRSAIISGLGEKWLSNI